MGSTTLKRRSTGTCARAHGGGLVMAVALAGLASCVTPNALAREWEAQIASAPTCEVALENVADSITATWKQVRSKGFSLCVPPEWRILRRPTFGSDPYGRGAWRGDESSFYWSYAPGRISRDCGGPVRIGEQSWFETIGDEEVCLILTTRNVRAYWDDGLAISGAGRDGIVVDRLLAVIRTVRLLGRAPPP